MSNETAPRHTGSAKSKPTEAGHFLSAPEVKARYGVSDMWLHRRLHDGSGFPPPDLIVRTRRFWKLSKLEAWERRKATA